MVARGRKRKSQELPPRYPEGEKEATDGKEGKKAAKPSFRVEQLDELELRRLLAQSQDRRLQAAAASNALTQLTLLFPSWLLQLQHGFSLLLHGYGCKRTLLQRFSQHCSDTGYAVVTVCGGDNNAASITPKRLVLLLAEAIKSRRGNISEKGAGRRRGRESRCGGVGTHSTSSNDGEAAESMDAQDMCTRNHHATWTRNGRGAGDSQGKQSSCPASLQQAQRRQQQSQSLPAVPRSEVTATGGVNQRGGMSCPVAGPSERQRLSGTVADRVRCLLDIAATSAGHQAVAKGIMRPEGGYDEEGDKEEGGGNEGEAEEFVCEDEDEEGIEGGYTRAQCKAKRGNGTRSAACLRESEHGAHGLRESSWSSQCVEGEDKLEPVIVVINGFDCHPLCHAENVTLLAALAASGVVRLVAAVDNVLSSALFDQQTLCQFNFASHRVLTGQPYDLDVSSLPFLHSSTSSSSHIAAAKAVLLSLPPNAREVFRLVATTRAAETGDGAGLSFQQLYSRCRSQFIVSNEVTLRAHLRELSDHELVRAGRQADGADVIVVALPRDALASVLADL